MSHLFKNSLTKMSKIYSFKTLFSSQNFYQSNQIKNFSNSINLLSKKTTSINQYKFQISKGAKRKTERTPVQDCDHLLNIAKDRDDSVIVTDEYYPPWLLEMTYPDAQLNSSFDNWDFMALVGQDMPTEENIIDIMRSQKKLCVRNHKIRNRQQILANAPRTKRDRRRPQNRATEHILEFIGSDSDDEKRQERRQYNIDNDLAVSSDEDYDVDL